MISSPENCFPAFDVPPEWSDTPWLVSNPSDRGFDEYSLSLGVDFRVFKGKRILDLGAGATAKFAREAYEHGIEVHSVNPGWASEEYLPGSDRGDIYDNAVAARAEQLPYKDASFDFVVSFWSVPFYLPGTEQAYRDTFSELRRVLAPDGWALLVPVPKMTYYMQKLHDIVQDSFPDEHEFVGVDFLPKLLLYKELNPTTRDFIDALKPSIDASTFPIW